MRGFWTADQIAKLDGHWPPVQPRPNKGWSAQLIGDLIGKSRSAVLGRRHRTRGTNRIRNLEAEVKRLRAEIHA